MSALRHANPRAVTLMLSAHSSIEDAAHIILLQVDEILVKSTNLPEIVETIQERLLLAADPTRIVHSAGAILDREVDDLIARWLRTVEGNKALQSVSIGTEQRTAYLPLMLYDLIERLNSHQPIGASRSRTQAPYEHGADRFRQGYTSAMIVEESRYLQVCIFETLQLNLGYIDFSVVLSDVMVIADEVDAQLGYMMEGYSAASELCLHERRSKMSA